MILSAIALLHACRRISETAFLILFYATVLSGQVTAQERFVDNFDNGLSNWELTGAESIKIIDSKFSDHGNVLVLQPNNKVRALIRNSDQWGPVRIEADILFPDDKSNYLGIIYNYTETAERSDFGSIYIKGNGSYMRANPWRDDNASRLLYEELKTRLTGRQAININQWHPIKVEVFDHRCHFYVENMDTPQMTFDLYEHDSGKVGFKPRIVGWPVWIDNVRVNSIRQLSYQGPNIPAIDYHPEQLITNWEVAGPWSKPIDEIERYGSQDTMAIGNLLCLWKPFRTDARGAVITGRVIQYSGDKSVAYFRTKIDSDRNKTVTLHLSTVDEIALWVNDQYEGFIYRDGYISLPENDWNAWYDFSVNPQHEGTKVEIALKKGLNHLVLRVRAGQFASGGFFAKLEE